MSDSPAIDSLGTLAQLIIDNMGEGGTGWWLEDLCQGCGCVASKHREAHEAHCFWQMARDIVDGQ